MYLNGGVATRRPPILQDGVTVKEEELVLVVLAGLFKVLGHNSHKITIGDESNKLLQKRRCLSHAGGSDVWGVFFSKGKRRLYIDEATWPHE